VKPRIHSHDSKGVDGEGLLKVMVLKEQACSPGGAKTVLFGDLGGLELGGVPGWGLQCAGADSRYRRCADQFGRSGLGGTPISRNGTLAASVWPADPIAHRNRLVVVRVVAAREPPALLRHAGT